MIRTKAVDPVDPPLVQERVIRGVTVSSLADALTLLLVERGYKVQPAEPRGTEAAPSFWSLCAVRESVLDARRRLVGKVAAIFGVLVVMFVLALFIVGETRAWVLDWTITIGVVSGGLGLMPFRHPPNRVRRTVEARLEAAPSDVRMTVREGVCRVREEGLSEWLRDQTAEFGDEQVDEFVRRVSGDEPEESA